MLQFCTKLCFGSAGDHLGSTPIIALLRCKFNRGELKFLIQQKPRVAKAESLYKLIPLLGMKFAKTIFLSHEDKEEAQICLVQASQPSRSSLTICIISEARYIINQRQERNLITFTWERLPFRQFFFPIIRTNPSVFFRNYD